MSRMTIQVSPAEVIDRYLILKLKAERFTDPGKRAQAHRDAMELFTLRCDIVADKPALYDLEDQLWNVHKQIWDAEDRLRTYENGKMYNCGFIEQSRLIMHSNDERAAIKREIDLLLGAVPGDVKEYQQ